MGVLDVHKMLGEMTWAQFYAWWCFYHYVEPFGEERDDLRVGQLAAFIGNYFRFGKQRGKKFKPLDFMPYSKDGKVDRRKPMKTKEQWDHFKGVFKSWFV